MSELMSADPRTFNDDQAAIRKDGRLSGSEASLRRARAGDAPRGGDHRRLVA